MTAGDFDPEHRKNLILASAYFHPPRRWADAEPNYSANTFRVLGNALIAAGLWEDWMKDAFHGCKEIADFSLFNEWYNTLIELTREPEPTRLLQGAGNLGTVDQYREFEDKAGAYFTACWLTPAGHTYAEQLLADHPDWKPRLTTRPAKE